VLKVWGVRLLFAFLILLLPVQLVQLKFFGGEPYPALFMPGFGSVPQDGEYVTVPRTVVTAVSRSGDEFDVDYIRLIPNETKLAESIASDFFADRNRVERAAADGWLEKRLSSLYPGEAFSKLSVQTSVRLVDLKTGVKRDTELKSYSVELGGGAE
jgi:hypothetical protein